MKASISTLIMICHKRFICGEENKNKKNNYMHLKEEILDKLCIKNLIIKLNEVEKLKLFALNEEQRKSFNSHHKKIDKNTFGKLLNKLKGKTEEPN